MIILPSRENSLQPGFLLFSINYVMSTPQFISIPYMFDICLVFHHTDMQEGICFLTVRHLSYFKLKKIFFSDKYLLQIDVHSAQKEGIRHSLKTVTNRTKQMVAVGSSHKCVSSN